MPIDLKAPAPGTSLAPVIFMRWLALGALLVSVTASAGGLLVPLPAFPLLTLAAIGAALNIHAATAFRRKRVPERVVRVQLILDILLYGTVLAFTGGIENPFAILLLAPLAMAASLLSLFSLCVLLLLTLLVLSVISFTAWPLVWGAFPPVLSPAYTHGIWIALVTTVTVVSFIIWRLAMEGRRLSDALGRTHAILEEKKRNSALGTLAAAAVHELGSPLATIAVAVHEMARDIHPDDPLAEDVELLQTQTEKCKRILADLARAPEKTRHGLPRRLDRIVMEIAEAHADPQGRIRPRVKSDIPENLPVLSPSDNLEYGLGNLIANALSFAHADVEITVEATAETIEITIADDGPGFPAATLRAVGMPYISTRAAPGTHMGLGIFIATNLLEATDATLHFANAGGRGARVGVTWPRSALEAPDSLV